MNPVLSYQTISDTWGECPDLPPTVAAAPAPAHSGPAVTPGYCGPPTVPATATVPTRTPVPVHRATITPAHRTVPIDRLIDDPVPLRAVSACTTRHDVAVLDAISFALAHMRQFGGCLALGAGALVECALGLLPVASPSPDLLFSVGLALTACPAALITARYCAVRLGCRQPRPAG